jgi:hypothetical protein
MADDRERFAKEYRDQGAAELMALFDRRADLSANALDALRDELRLRGLDPDTLKATVPKAMPGPDDRSGRGDGAEPVDAAGEAGDVRGDLDVYEPPPLAERPSPELDPGGADGDSDSESAEEATSSSSAAEDPAEAAAPPGSIASATFGLLGVSGLVFGGYLWSGAPAAIDAASIAAALGLTSVVVALVLYRRSVTVGT